MSRGKEIVERWLKNQDDGKYSSFDESMADLANMIDTPITTPTELPEDNDKWSYREEQARLRAAGFDAYNCDMVDEFPTW